jgi:bilin biosynthesis protein
MDALILKQKYIFCYVSSHTQPMPSFLPAYSAQPIDPVMTDALIEVVNQQIMLHGFEEEDSGLIDRVIEHLADDRAQAQAQLLDALGEIGELATSKLVKALTDHASSLVRSGAARALAKIRAKEAAPLLVQALIQDIDPGVRAAAAAALSRLEEAAVPLLISVLASESCDETQKGQASWALSLTGIEGLALLLTVRAHPVVDVRCAVLRSIAKISLAHPNRSALDCLHQALNDPIGAVRAAAIQSLAELHDQGAIGSIAKFIQDPEVDVRQAAVLALGRLRDPAAFSSLKIALEDPVQAVRSLAQLSMNQLQLVSGESHGTE